MSCIEIDGPESQVEDFMRNIFLPDMSLNNFNESPEQKLSAPPVACEMTGLFVGPESGQVNGGPWRNIDRPTIAPIRVLWGPVS
ncbi:unnamed protein product [Protopolystoma xenopodis]|uniref:Uncharacterized protein n=1 Tax=Protopolystoma xenopodis TaxID=117903 RepID=A0A448X7U4_9PLAT|nr:unnamed protein product [Protopolystoma xenopodis]